MSSIPDVSPRRRVAFVPCRSGSEKVYEKNTRPFAGIEGGLLQLKLSQLQDSELVDEIVVSSNDPKVLEISARFKARTSKPTFVVERPENLCIASTSMDDVAIHACDVIGDADIVWAFVTSPLVTGADYDDMIAVYERVTSDGTHDSLMTVTMMHKFLWTNSGPFNYQREPLKWPRSQDLETLYDANQASFIIGTSTSRRSRDRVGDRPFLYELTSWKAVDVDWEDDFRMAEILYTATVQDAAG